MGKPNALNEKQILRLPLPVEKAGENRKLFRRFSAQIDSRRLL